jgi:hypothetical protein
VGDGGRTLFFEEGLGGESLSGLMKDFDAMFENLFFGFEIILWEILEALSQYPIILSVE